MAEPRCCICQQVLPNRWAIGGHCAEPGCEAVFCQLHAHGGNGRCPAHGWKEDGKAPKAADRKEGEKMDKENERAEGERDLREAELVKSAPKELAAKAMAEAVSFAGKVGGGLRSLWSKIHVDRSPEAMLVSLNGALDGNRRRRDAASAELDAAYRGIVEKKKAYEAASPVRRRILKMELEALMAQYKGLEREYALLCENEKSIASVKGRFMEVLAHGLRGPLDEDMVDRLADTIEEKSDDAEDLQDALGDLDKAGRRRDRDDGSFDAALSEFDSDGAWDVPAADPAATPVASADETMPERPSRDRDGITESPELG